MLLCDMKSACYPQIATRENVQTWTCFYFSFWCLLTSCLSMRLAQWNWGLLSSVRNCKWTQVCGGLPCGIAKEFTWSSFKFKMCLSIACPRSIVAIKNPREWVLWKQQHHIVGIRRQFMRIECCRYVIWTLRYVSTVGVRCILLLHLCNIKPYFWKFIRRLPGGPIPLPTSSHMSSAALRSWKFILPLHSHFRL